MMAAKHDVAIKVLFSHSTDHYVRAYVLTRYGARRADESVQAMGHILHCFACFHREAIEGMFSPLKRKCPECGSKLNVTGPLWLGKLFDEDFCSLMEKETYKRRLEEKRILKLLYLTRNEIDAPITYYVVDKLCDKFDLPIPPLIKVIDGLKSAGFQAVPTHFNSRGVRTDAPASTLRLILSSLSSSK